MKFLVDQNLEPDIAISLRDYGFDARHTTELGLERADDVDLFEYCREVNCALITADIRLGKYLADSGATDPSVVILRGYGFGSRRSAKTIPDLIAVIPVIENTCSAGDSSVFMLQPDKPTRIHLLPFSKRTK